MSDENKKDPAAAASFPIGGAVVDGGAGDAEEPMTEKQAAELRELAEKAGEPVDGNLTRGQAEARIEALKKTTDS